MPSAGTSNDTRDRRVGGRHGGESETTGRAFECVRRQVYRGQTDWTLEGGTTSPINRTNEID